MGDYGFEPYDAETTASDGESRLPGRISLQSAAAVLLILVVVATLYLFFGPMPDDGAAVPPTPTTLAAATAAGASTATLSAVPLSTVPLSTAGASGAGSSAAGTPSPATLAGVATVALAQPTSATPSLLGASAATPLPGGALAVGTYVTVAGVGSDGLRYRMGAGADYLTIRIVAEGETLKILGGPETEGGTSYWRAQDALGNVGWAAEPFLTAAAAPPAWNPPLASPTFEADLNGLLDGGAGGTAP